MNRNRQEANSVDCLLSGIAVSLKLFSPYYQKSWRKKYFSIFSETEIVLYCVISYRIIYHIISYHHIIYHIISYHIIYHHISYHIISSYYIILWDHRRICGAYLFYRARKQDCQLSCLLTPVNVNARK